MFIVGVVVGVIWGKVVIRDSKVFVLERPIVVCVSTVRVVVGGGVVVGV